MSASTGLVTRFAPAPTGWLHLGHVLNAVHVWRLAREHHGRVLLRIEDHDAQRCRPEFERAIRDDLAWLGFVADETAPRQSTRGPVYRRMLAPLVARGLVYRCTCTRQHIAIGADPGAARVVAIEDERRYPGTCRDRDAITVADLDNDRTTDDAGWRVRMDPGVETFVDGWCGPQSQDPSTQCGDVLVRDRLGNWTYQWAVSVDDHLQGVTHVVRGGDLLASTGRQLRLARLMGRSEPPVYVHHVLIMKSGSQKLSKSDGDSGVRALRAAGWSPAQVIDEALSRSIYTGSAPWPPTDSRSSPGPPPASAWRPR